MANRNNQISGFLGNITCIYTRSTYSAAYALYSTTCFYTKWWWQCRSFGWHACTYRQSWVDLEGDRNRIEVQVIIKVARAVEGGKQEAVGSDTLEFWHPWNSHGSINYVIKTTLCLLLFCLPSIAVASSGVLENLPKLKGSLESHPQLISKEKTWQRDQVLVLPIADNTVTHMS